jgi:hypothetical protein
MPEVRRERTGWRDEELSRRHREWGWDCPMVDIDFLALEYDDGKAVAIVEYKHEGAMPQDYMNKSYQALKDLANKAQLPLFAVWYSRDFTSWKVDVLNKYAKAVAPSKAILTEKEYVEFLYSLRMRVLPNNLKLKTTSSLHLLSNQILSQIKNLSVPAYALARCADIQVSSNTVHFIFWADRHRFHYKQIKEYQPAIKTACSRVLNKEISLEFILQSNPHKTEE